MAAITEINDEHIEFLKKLLIKETKNTNYKGSQLLLDVLTHFSETKKVNLSASDLLEPELAEDLRILDRIRNLFFLERKERMADAERKANLSKEELANTPEDPTKEEIPTKHTDGSKLLTLTETPHVTPQVTPQATPLEIINKVTTLSLQNDVSGLEFIKNLTPVEIESILSYVKNNRYAVKQNIESITKSIIPNNEHLTTPDDYVDIVLSIIERVPLVTCFINPNSGLTMISVSYNSELLTDGTFSFERWILNMNRLIKFDSKTKHIECDNLCFTKVEDNIENEQIQLIFYVM